MNPATDMNTKRTQELHTLYREHRGKRVDKWPLYLDFYARVFGPMRDKPIRLLEIGIQNGGSLELWQKYFPRAAVLVGCDIDPGCAKLVYDDPRIRVVVGDANDATTQASILHHSQTFDIIIDDGSHCSGDIVRAFCRYFPLLSDGGLYIMEDLHCSYWGAFEGGLFHPFSSIAFAKSLADTINHEHWRISASRHDLLSPFLQHYHTKIPEVELAHVQSVEVANSVCLVRKAPPDRNLLGERSPAGDEAAVTNRPLRACGGHVPDSNAELRNPWSAFSHQRRTQTAIRLKLYGRPLEWLRRGSPQNLLGVAMRLLGSSPASWNPEKYVAEHGKIMGPFWIKFPKLHYALFAQPNSVFAQDCSK